MLMCFCLTGGRQKSLSPENTVMICPAVCADDLLKHFHCLIRYNVSDLLSILRWTSTGLPADAEPDPDDPPLAELCVFRTVCRATLHGQPQTLQPQNPHGHLQLLHGVLQRLHRLRGEKRCFSSQPWVLIFSPFLAFMNSFPWKFCSDTSLKMEIRIQTKLLDFA